jgi:hypothetical protein
LKERGDDLSKSRDIDFFFAFEFEQSARNFVEQVQLTTNLSAKASPFPSNTNSDCNFVG